MPKQPRHVGRRELKTLVQQLADPKVYLQLPAPGQPDPDEVLILDPKSQVPIWWPVSDSLFWLMLRQRLPRNLGDLPLRGQLLELLSTLRHMKVGLDERGPLAIE